jgi:hypothetical protein
MLNNLVNIPGIWPPFYGILNEKTLMKKTPFECHPIFPDTSTSV